MEHAGISDPYRVLGVSAGASQQDITRAYRRGVQHAHPDARPRDPAAAAARFQALTAAYDLLRDPGRRAAYDRHHPARQPSSPPPQPRQPGPASRRRGPAFLLRPPSSSPIWAGPVYIEPSAPATGQHACRAVAADFEDPAVILGPLPGQVWGWPR
jgi:curved DNA-binding protein CbpA